MALLKSEVKQKEREVNALQSKVSELYKFKWSRAKFYRAAQAENIA